MKQKWRDLAEKFDALAVRERLILVGALLGGVVFFWDLFAFQSHREAQAILVARENNARQAVQSAEAELTVLESVAARDPNIALRKDLQDLQQRVKELDSQLDALSGGLVSGTQLPAILHQVLQQTGKVRLVSMLTLPPEELRLRSEQSAAVKTLSQTAPPVTDTPAGLTTAQQRVRLFKHGVTMTLQGDYAGIAEYLHRLEGGDWRFYWESAQYQVQRYPQAQVVLKVFTLATDRGVLHGK